MDNARVWMAAGEEMWGQSGLREASAGDWVDGGFESRHPGTRTAEIGASSSLPRAPAKVRSQTDLQTLALARQPFLGQGLRVIAASR